MSAAHTICLLFFTDANVQKICRHSATFIQKNIMLHNTTLAGRQPEHALKLVESSIKSG